MKIRRVIYQLAALAATTLPLRSWANVSHLGDNFWHLALIAGLVAPPLVAALLVRKGRRVVTWIGLQVVWVGLALAYFYAQSNTNSKLQEAFNTSVFSGIDRPHQAYAAFPDGAASVEASELESLLAGRVFKLAEPHRSGTWRLDFRSSHDLFVDGDTTFRDAGQWSTEGTRLCVKGRRIAASCHEVRTQGALLFIRRTTGEVVQLVNE